MSEITENKETLEKQKAEADANQESNNEAVEQEEVLAEDAVEEVVEVDVKEAKIAELEVKIAEQEALYLRLRADYDNLARRSRLDREAAEKYRAQSLLTDLLPVIDNLDRALLAEANVEEKSPLYKGVDMVYRQLLDATAREGLEVIEAVGQPFDPNVHQAVMQESDSEQQPGVVLKELQKGYKLKDRVLRPSMVSVND